MSEDFGNSFMLYKARSDGSGAASQWSMGSKKDCVFLEMSTQKGKGDDGNARFDWDNKIRFKLGESDIGEILAVLTNLQDGVGPFDTDKRKHKGLYHKNKNGNAILYFGKDKNKRLRVFLSVKSGSEVSKVDHAITTGEACILATLLRRAVEVMYRWN